MQAPYESLGEGRYKLIDVLGEGGMATVYRAYDERLRVYRAIKVLSPELMANPRLRQRFENEARTMARLHHPNIVTVHDVVSDGQLAYIVMELVGGGSLMEELERGGAVSPRRAAQLGCAILSALKLAHREGVIHRDIKPHNVLIDAHGTPKLGDFGIAQAQDQAQMTRTGSTMGTLGYMAPEQQDDARGVEVSSDLYAVGATLFALTTGRAPVNLFAHDRDPSILKGVPQALLPVVARATNYHPAYRYASADEMRAALEAAAATLPSEAAPGGAPTRVPDHASAQQPSAETMVFLAEGEVSGFAVSTGGEDRTEPPSGSAPGLAGVSAGGPPRALTPPPVGGAPAAERSSPGRSSPAVDTMLEEPAPAGGTMLEEPASRRSPALAFAALALLALLGGGGWYLSGAVGADPPTVGGAPASGGSPETRGATAAGAPTPAGAAPAEREEAPPAPEEATPEQPPEEAAPEPSPEEAAPEEAPEETPEETRAQATEAPPPAAGAAAPAASTAASAAEPLEPPQEVAPEPPAGVAVSLSGDPGEIWLFSGDARVRLPAGGPRGAGERRAAWGGGDPRVAGTVTLPESGAVVVNCVALIYRCQASP
jgi:serine/threonine protein kinase